MRRNAQIRLHLLQHADHGLRVQPIQSQAATRILPRLVRALVNHSHQLRGASHHRNVGFIIGALEKFADVFNGVNVLHAAIATRGERFFQCLRGPDVAGAGRGR